MTDATDFLLMIFILLISFIAYILFVRLSITFQTLPKPPFPIGSKTSKLFFVIKSDLDTEFIGKIDCFLIIWCYLERT